MSQSTETNMWVIRAGIGGSAHHLFLEDGVIALADVRLGNLLKIAGTRDAFYSVYRKLYPDKSRSESAGIGGKFSRFVHAIEVGDLVLYPSLRDKTIYIGQVLGDYLFDKSDSEGFPHRRTVKWNYMVPKGEFSRAAFYELGTARTFFRFSNHTDEVMQKIADKSTLQFRKKAQ